MIRRATLADLREIVDLVAEFHSAPQWHGLIEFDPASFERTATRIIEHGVVFLSQKGLIGLTVGPSIYDENLLVCAELFFWAPDGRGTALRRAAEDWAAHRADIIVMGSHDGLERVDTWYRRAGYLPIGTQYAKGL